MLILDNLNLLKQSKRLSPSTVARYRYELATWSRYDDPLLSCNVSRLVIEKWRHDAEKSGLKPRTIESVIQSVATLMKVGSCPVETGHRLRHVPQPPDCPTLEQFDGILQQCRETDPFRLWLAVAYVTGFRLADLMWITADDVASGAVSRTAEKTFKAQPTQVPDCLQRIGRQVATGLPIPGGRLSPATPRTIRKRLDRLCLQAGVPRITPQQIRVLSATEWERARPGCGAVILGHALPGWSAATYYYLRSQEQLRMGLPNLRIPPSLLTDEERRERESGEGRLIQTFRGLPESQRQSLVTVAEAMAR